MNKESHETIYIVTMKKGDLTKTWEFLDSQSAGTDIEILKHQGFAFLSMKEKVKKRFLPLFVLEGHSDERSSKFIDLYNPESTDLTAVCGDIAGYEITVQNLIDMWRFIDKAVRKINRTQLKVEPK